MLLYQGSTSNNIYLMVFERGPLAFLDGPAQLLHGYVFHGTGMQQVSSSASVYISERISVLSSLRYSLATFLAQVLWVETFLLIFQCWIIFLSFITHQVYVEVEKSREQILKEPGKSLAALLGTVNGLFLILDAAIGHFSATHQASTLHFICYLKM